MTTRTLPDAIRDKLRRGEIDEKAADAFVRNLDRVHRDVYSHEVIVANPYTKWFKLGQANTAQVRDLVVQFSVFSNHFIPLEAKRMVHAATEEEEMEARNILGSEIGVPINVRTGDIEGLRFSHGNAHIKWLRDIGEMLGLDRNRLGKWALGTPATHRFLEQLDKVYGSPDNSIGSGASFAIESWAGFGIGKGEEAEGNNFWSELVAGLEAYNAREREPLNLESLDVSFFRFHFELESGHVASVEHELADLFFSEGFDPEKWHRGAREALNAMLVFWKGLDAARQVL